jgi:eukaryotic-like serine/threonine-protein kinase
VNPVKVHPSRKQLIAFVRGKLGASSQAAIASHIEACDACCQMLREIPDDAFLELIRDAHTPASSGDFELTATPSKENVLPRELSEHSRYKIGRFLGAGGMGLVYQAEHRLMGRVVALKIIHQHLIQHPRVIERFRLEVKAAARLSHPNIVAAYDAEHAGDVHFLVMEFVDGINLSLLVARKGPLEVASACNFIRQAGRGLQHAFEKGMVHRDIKPHNLMMTRKGQIKILDFGLARLASESRAELGLPPGPDRPGLTRVGDIMGTPAYMAPEQILDASSADIRADLYSLGCTLYHLLTGQSPFAKDSARAALFSRQYLPPRPITELRKDLPAELLAVLNKMLAEDPAERYQTPIEVVNALTPFIKSGPAPLAASVKPAPPPTPAKTGETPRGDSQGFLAQCPFCAARLRIPDKALGASLPCPHCSCYFTAVPVEQRKK